MPSALPALERYGVFCGEAPPGSPIRQIVVASQPVVVTNRSPEIGSVARPVGQPIPEATTRTTAAVVWSISTMSPQARRAT